MNVANGSISLLGQNPHPLVVATAAEDDRVLCRDQPAGSLASTASSQPKKRIWGLGNAVEGQQLVHDDLSHALGD